MVRFSLRHLVFKRVFVSIDLQTVITLALAFNGKLRMLEMPSDECRNNLSI